ncbi:MAG: pyridoxal phosphate-dependent aminotransferase [Candidatus Omnitrophota bacterium]|jgi:hypothetical protein
MTPFSKRTDWPVHPNPLALKVQSLRGCGARILDLTVTNPTRCGFRYLNAKVLEAFAAQKNLDYDPDPHGLMEARQAVAGYYAQKGVEVREDQIFMTASTSEAYSFAFRLLADAGETILAPAPGYPILDFLASLCDVNVRRYNLQLSEGASLDGPALTEQIRAVKPRAVLFVHPNNPTGQYVGPDDRKTLSAVLENFPVPVLADEVFLDFPLEPAMAVPESFASHCQTLSLTLSGISKILGMPQMKLSWIIVSGPEDLRRKAIEKLEIISDTYLSAATPVQNALPVWMAEREAIQGEIKSRIQANYAHLSGILKDSRKLKLLPAKGGWVAVLAAPAERSDEEWALRLLERDSLLIHPGFLYDFPSGPYLVASLLTPEDLFREAMDKILMRIQKG